MTEEELQQIERRLAGYRDAFPPDTPITANVVSLSRLKDIQQLIAEVRRLKAENRGLIRELNSYTAVNNRRG